MVISKFTNWLKQKVTNLLAPKPGINLAELDFIIPPYILKSKEIYFLCYQISTAKKKPLKRVLYSRKSKVKAYYFFSIPVSDFENGTLIRRDISQDGFGEYLKSGNVYWLNKDGTEVHLQIKKE